MPGVRRDYFAACAYKLSSLGPKKDLRSTPCRGEERGVVAVVFRVLMEAPRNIFSIYLDIHDMHTKIIYSLK